MADLQFALTLTWAQRCAPLPTQRLLHGACVLLWCKDKIKARWQFPGFVKARRGLDSRHGFWRVWRRFGALLSRGTALVEAQRAVRVLDVSW